MDDFTDLERERWRGFAHKDAALLERIYADDAISIGYAEDGSLGARRTAELLRGVDQLDVENPELDDFAVVPLNQDAAIVSYRVSYHSRRSGDWSVRASSVWQREQTAWKTKLFQATAERRQPGS